MVQLDHTKKHKKLDRLKQCRVGPSGKGLFVLFAPERPNDRVAHLISGAKLLVFRQEAAWGLKALLDWYPASCPVTAGKHASLSTTLNIMKQA